jgi:hypothetical protein
MYIVSTGYDYDYRDAVIFGVNASDQWFFHHVVQRSEPQGLDVFARAPHSVSFLNHFATNYFTVSRSLLEYRQASLKIPTPMSYNPNQPFEQWQQQQPIDPNQQRPQISTPQATTSNPPSNPTDGGGNYQQIQQSYSWTDGNAQGQHHQSQQSWSWQGHVPLQQQDINPVALQCPPPIFPPLLQNDHSAHHLLHQQMHQNAASHFQQAQAHHHQQVTDMHRNMSTFAMSNVAPVMVQSPQPPQIAY